MRAIDLLGGKKYPAVSMCLGSHSWLPARLDVEQRFSFAFFWNFDYFYKPRFAESRYGEAICSE